jgi:hypothetical protein
MVTRLLGSSAAVKLSHGVKKEDTLPVLVRVDGMVRRFVGLSCVLYAASYSTT